MPRKKPPWPNMCVKFWLKDSRVVATFEDDGGAIVEMIERLEFTEGRSYSEHGNPEGGPSVPILEYTCGFGVPDTPIPLGSEAAFARIVITGKHDNGKRIEIRGEGWVGYDNNGHIEGNFDDPPFMITQTTEFISSPSDPEPMTPEEFDRHLKAEYPMPKQFQNAVLRVGKSDRWGSDEK